MNNDAAAKSPMLFEGADEVPEKKRVRSDNRIFRPPA